jgi:hypothetical protein
MSSDSQNYYDDSPDSQAPSPSADSTDVKTSILPKSFFGGRDLKVGLKCDVEITAIHENDVEVKGCSSPDEDDTDSQDDESTEAPSDSEGASDMS